MNKEGKDANFVLDRMSDLKWREIDRDMLENGRDPRYEGLNAELALMMPHSGMPVPEQKKQKVKMVPKAHRGPKSR